MRPPTTPGAFALTLPYSPGSCPTARFVRTLLTATAQRSPRLSCFGRPRELVRRVKHHAIDVQLSLSDLVARALYQQLSTEEKTMNQPQDHDPGMRLRPMVHVEDMAASVAFYEQLGGEIVHGSRDGDWVLLRLAGAQIGLLAHPPNPEQNEGTVELNFEATEPLEQLEERLRAAGVQIARPTNDEGFGRQLQLASPDGLLLKIDELEPELYS